MRSGDQARLRVAMRVDASPRMGGGHVMRCLTLADALGRKGASVVFVSGWITETLIARIRESGHDFRRIEPAATSAALQGPDWDSVLQSPEEQRMDADRFAEALGDFGPDLVVADHYQFDSHWHGSARAHAKRLLLIDDLANRKVDCDLLHDPTFGRREEEYERLVPANARLLIGPEYALLRPEFAAARPQALARRQGTPDVRRVLISMGMTDVGGLTRLAFESVASALPEAAVDVLLGSSAPTLEEVREVVEARPGARLLVDHGQVAELMVSADMAIGAAGSTSWERCCLALPTITLALASNQRAIAERLAEAGAVHLPDGAEQHDLAAAVRRVATDDFYRSALIANSARICDGLGTQRLLECVEESLGRCEPALSSSFAG